MVLSKHKVSEPSKEVDDLAREIIGALIEVHRRLGPGFVEKIYEEAVCIELKKRNIPFERQVVINVQYDEIEIGEGRIDLLVDKKIILELKAVESLNPIHQAQILSYLRIIKLELGLLINFNVPVLKNGIKRVVLS